jgi:hypothetical protein
MSVDPTSLAAYASSVQQSQLQEQVAMKVAKKSLDAAKQQGQAAIALLESAAQITRGAEPGKGVHLDAIG